MNEKIQEILSVLDMSEEEQYDWLASQFTKLYFSTDDWPKWYGVCDILLNRSGSPAECLSHVAFMLRDEVLKSKNGTMGWVNSMFDVYMKMTGIKLLNWKWGYIEAQPIHWIIAALIAKEDRKGELEC